MVMLVNLNLKLQYQVHKKQKNLPIDQDQYVFELCSDQIIYLVCVLEFVPFSIISSEPIIVVTIKSFINLPSLSPLIHVGYLFLYELTEDFNANYRIEITLQINVVKTGISICYYVS